jgi:hypothetical protein
MTVSAIYLTTGILITAVIVVLVVVWVNRNNQKRTLALQQLALSLHFTFYPKGEGSVQGTFEGFDLFSRGYAKKFTNLMTGRFRNLSVSIFDYQYVTGGGKNAHLWKQSVIALESAQLNLPEFILRPENLVDKIGHAFGKKDIDFDTCPQFSKQYFLRGSSEELVRRLFSERALRYFEENPGQCVEGDGNRLIIYRSSTLIPAENMQTRMQESYDIYTFFKTY